MDAKALDELFSQAIRKHQAGQLPEAEAMYLQILGQRPNDARTMHALGVVLGRMNKSHEAVKWISKAVQIDANAGYMSNLSKFYMDVGRFNEAAQVARRSIQTDPTIPGAYMNLGLACTSLQRIDEAIGAYRKYLELKPGDTEIQNSLRLLYRCQDPTDEAISLGYKDLEQRTGDLQMYTHLIEAMAKKGRFVEIAAVCRRALLQHPNDGKIKWLMSLALMTLGDYELGFRQYEHRWEAAPPGLLRPGPFREPLWDGKPMPGKTLLLHAEQGLGDTIQFIRYAKRISDRGTRVVVASKNEGLVDLLNTCPGVAKVVTEAQDAGKFDAWLSMMSLPLICQTRFETIGEDGLGKTPYLFPPKNLISDWASRVSFPKDRLKVGFVWAGNPSHVQDRYRSVTLAHYQTLAKVPGVQGYSLQVGKMKYEPEFAPQGMELIDPTDGITTMMDTAAIVSQLDLVITVDTAVAHLAGALGKPVWVLVRAIPDWRWTLQRDDTPWYPTMRLLRQPVDGDWESVIVRVRQALEKEVSRP
jgi:Flp pilus assembly protein TadD